MGAFPDYISVLWKLIFIFSFCEIPHSRQTNCVWFTCRRSGYLLHRAVQGVLGGCGGWCWGGSSSQPLPGSPCAFRLPSSRSPRGSGRNVLTNFCSALLKMTLSWLRMASLSAVLSRCWLRTSSGNHPWIVFRSVETPSKSSSPSPAYREPFRHCRFHFRPILLFHPLPQLPEIKSNSYCQMSDVTAISKYIELVLDQNFRLKFVFSLNIPFTVLWHNWTTFEILDITLLPNEWMNPFLEQPSQTLIVIDAYMSR